MSNTIEAKFDTRREAEMSVERLVQQFGIERSDIFITAAGSENTAGVEEAGSDTASGAPTVEPRDDAELTGAVLVSVDVVNEEVAGEIRAALLEFDPTQIATP